MAILNQNEKSLLGDCLIEFLKKTPLLLNSPISFPSYLLSSGSYIKDPVQFYIGLTHPIGKSFYYQLQMTLASGSKESLFVSKKDLKRFLLSIVKLKEVNCYIQMNQNKKILLEKLAEL